ncbi:MAG TPA: glycoside hydrolase family 125 protein [Candidatus Limnocylindrales bacterium]|nr:glycoside hydrolase family 125 protein [Candidatus Limnocylindrales bacterium]
MTSGRVPAPSPAGRVAVPPSLHALIAEVEGRLAHRPRLAAMFGPCIRNALDTTVTTCPDGTAFVATGDIPAMWIRDSAAQVRPYLVLAAGGDETMADLIEAVIRRQCAFLRLDPYANAFNAVPGPPGNPVDRPLPHPLVWERKFELDSGCWPLLLAHDLWRATGRTAHVDDRFEAAARAILETWRVEQDHEARSGYRFHRPGAPAIDRLGRDGRGPRVAPTGMVWSGFRPSDDATTHGYLVPANLLATVALAALADLADAVARPSLAVEARGLRAEIAAGLEAHAVVPLSDGGTAWAYEVDGMGGVLLADDANLPSLLALPWLGVCAPDDQHYRATRAIVLSDANPWFARGHVAHGIGSPHTPRGWVWHLALITQALTATDPAEREAVLDMLERTDAGTGLMHESFDPDDPRHFTRPWFGWANALLAELLLLETGLGEVLRRDVPAP